MTIKVNTEKGTTTSNLQILHTAIISVGGLYVTCVRYMGFANLGLAFRTAVSTNFHLKIDELYIIF